MEILSPMAPIGFSSMAMAGTSKDEISYLASSEKDGNNRQICQFGKPVGEGPLTQITEHDCETLFEVIGIKVLHMGTQNSAKVVGRINLIYPDGIWSLYDCDESSAKTLTLPGELPIRSPNIGMWGYDMTLITFDLEGDFEEINKESVTWYPGGPTNKIMTETCRGKDCSLEVSYVLLTGSVLAEIEINFLNKDERLKLDNEIYGNATAKVTKMASLINLGLFSKESNEASELIDNTKVPLPRSIVSVPFGSFLDIELELFCSPGLCIGSGIARFEAKYHGEHASLICGEYGKIEVKVTFWGYEDHPETKEDSRKLDELLKKLDSGRR